MSKSSRHGCHADAGCQSIGLARGWRCALHPLLRCPALSPMWSREKTTSFMPHRVLNLVTSTLRKLLL